MKFDIEFSDANVVAMVDRIDRGAQNAFKRGLRASLRVFRTAAAEYARSNNYPARFANPNRSFRTSVDTALLYSEPATVQGAGGKFTRNTARAATGFRVTGKLSMRFPGSIFEHGQRSHWIKITPAVLKWAREHDLVKQLLERKGLWLKSKGSAFVERPGRRGRKRVAFKGKRWFVPFDSPSGARLQKWAEAKGLTAAKAMLVHKQPPRPIVVPAAQGAIPAARAEFARVIHEWIGASQRG